MARRKVNKIDMREPIRQMAVKNEVTEESVIYALKHAFAAGWRADHRKSDVWHVARGGKVRFKDDKFYLDENGYIVAIIACKVVGFEEKEFDLDYTPMLPPKKDDYAPVKKEIERKIGDVWLEDVQASELSINGRKEFHKVLNDFLKLSLNENLLSYYQDKIGSIIVANVIDVTPKGIKASLGNDVESFISYKQLFAKDKYQVGDRIKVLVTGVLKEEKGGVRVSVTRNDSRMIEALYEDEFGNVREVVEFYKVAYEQGTIDETNRFSFGKCKVCVKRKNPLVDPVSTLIGNSGERSKRISNLLGLQLEIFEYSDNIAELIGRALKPATVLKIVGINEKEKKARVIVNDNQYSLAIGKAGVNARLAHEITSWGIDIKSETDAINEGQIF